MQTVSYRQVVAPFLVRKGYRESKRSEDPAQKGQWLHVWAHSERGRDRITVPERSDRVRRDYFETFKAIIWYTEKASDA